MNREKRLHAEELFSRILYHQGMVKCLTNVPVCVLAFLMFFTFFPYNLFWD